MGLFSKKIKVSESGLFKGFVDYHCHILPGVDDGFQTIENSISALKKYEAFGIVEVWLTPHVMEDIPNKPEDLKSRFEEFKQQYDGPITLHLASENMLDGLFKQRISEKNIVPMMDRWLLVETSYFNPPIDMDDMLDSTKSCGYFPILAHPERYMYMNKKNYEALASNSIKFQLNIGSLFGYYGPEVKNRAEWLLKHNFYSFVGTDLHSLKTFDHFLSETITEKIVSLLPR